MNDFYGNFFVGCDYGWSGKSKSCGIVFNVLNGKLFFVGVIEGNGLGFLFVIV